MFRALDRNIHVVYLAVLLVGIAYGTSISVLALHLDAHGVPELAMGWLAAAFALGIVLFSLPSGALLRRVPARLVLALAFVGYAVCVGLFPVTTSIPILAGIRFFDGAFSVAVWVSAETVLLARSRASEKAQVMSLYAIAMALGYVIGPLISNRLEALGQRHLAFFVASALAVAGAVVATRLDRGMSAAHGAAPGETTDDPDIGEPTSSLTILTRVKTACLATFSYGYFQSSVVLFLPIYLMRAKNVPKDQTILVTAFFALGMLVATNGLSRLGDRFGHLRLMRILGAIGGAMVGSFVLLSSFPWMCVAVFVAGASLASISPLSLALQGVVTPPAELSRANGFYNAAYALGMLIGPPLSGFLLKRFSGAAMLLHIAALWAFFVLFCVRYAKDDPAHRLISRSEPAHGPASVREPVASASRAACPDDPSA